MDTIQRKVYGMAISGHNLLITGKPGTGKTFLVCKIAEELNRMGRNVIATASTGVASASLREYLSGVTDVKVSTIHKFMGMRDGRFDNDELVHLLLFNENLQETKNRICQTNCLIIDEISLISKKTIEQIDFILRELKEINYCFGGIQVILCGDFFQLPCIPNPHYGDDGKPCYNFGKISCFHHVQLCDIHRQDEPDLIRAIHEIARYLCKIFARYSVREGGLELKTDASYLKGIHFFFSKKKNHQCQYCSQFRRHTPATPPAKSSALFAPSN